MTLSLPNVALAGTLVQVPPPPTGPAETQPQPEAQPLTEEEKAEKAKDLYLQAEGLAAEGKWVDAVPLYEQAYYLVPGKHGFAHKVGVAAWNARDCNKANEYLKHFIKYGDESKDADKFAEAKQILGEISVSGCATEDTSTDVTTPVAVAEDPDDNPIITSTTQERQEANRAEQERVKGEKRGLLIGGSVLLGIGVAGVAVGIAGLAMANGSANSLGTLSSNTTNTGFPEGDYACRGVPASECPFDLEKRMKTGNTLGYVGLGVGGAALVGGAAMLAIYLVNKKKKGNKGLEATPTEGEAGTELSGLGPMIIPGGAGAMAEIRF
ncbi:MAG TPA: hypothetical protein VM869_37455 [Enhygromyxa sp.]|nr:hypothetical protein [Enhygromyxa sp.]